MGRMTKLKRRIRNKAQQENMGRDLCFFVCVPPSIVLIDNKCILLCAIIWSKERKQQRTENETVVFIST